MSKDLQLNSSSIETLQKGNRKPSSPRMPIDVLNLIAQDDAMVRQAIAAEKLTKLTELETSKIPTGNLSLTRTILSGELCEIVFQNPLISFSLENTGAGDVRVKINNSQGIDSSVEIGVDRVYDLDTTYPIIKKIYLRADGDVVVNIFGIEGKAIGS